MSNSIKELLFKDIATSLEHWTEHSVLCLQDGHADLDWAENIDSFKEVQRAIISSGVSTESLKNVFSEILFGVIHSQLVILDGGTSLSETHEIKLCDEKGDVISKDLHSEFISYLIDNDLFD